MMRALAIVLGLALGLAAAAVIDGRMAHLRLVAGDRLPEWTAALPDETSLWRGRLPGEATELRWRFAGPSLSGPDYGLSWRLEAVGPGLRLEGDLLLPAAALLPGRHEARLTRMRGTVDLPGLAEDFEMGSGAAPGRPEGRLTVTQGGARIALPTLAVIELAAGGQLDGARLNGETLGSGPFLAEMGADGVWQMRVRLSGGAAPLEALVTGRLGSHQIELEMTLRDGQEELLPVAWRRALDRLDGPDGESVVFLMVFDLGG